MKQRTLTLIWSAFFLFSVSLAQAGSVEGKVMNDNTGYPVAQAQVSFSGPKSVIMRTKGNGEFSSKNLPNGQYDVIVKRGGQTQNFTATVSGKTNLNPFRVNW